MSGLKHMKMTNRKSSRTKHFTYFTLWSIILCILMRVVGNIFFATRRLHEETRNFRNLALNLFQRKKKCIAIGMFTRSGEYALRQWHRNVYQKHGNSHKYSNSVVIYLRFGMAKLAHNDELKTNIKKEIRRYKDIMIYNFVETEECMNLNRCLIRNHFALFEGIQSLCDDDNYVGTYFIKADNDSVLNYEQIARVFLHMPNESVLFGRLIPNTPVHSKLERMISDTALSFYPVWPHGTFQGYSKDLMQESLKSENKATVLHQESNYVFPWSDRGTGLQLYRAQIPIKYRVFLKGHYFMCASENFTCHAYWNSIAFHSGFGFSGNGNDKIQKKLEMMNKIYKTQLKCQNNLHDMFREADHYFFADDEFLLKGNSSFWLRSGCSVVNSDGLRLLKQMDIDHQIALRRLAPMNLKCADKIYRNDLEVLKNITQVYLTTPQYSKLNFDKTQGFSQAFLNKMLMANHSLGYHDSNFEMRYHYIHEGHASSSLHYYCPYRCDEQKNINGCAICDREAEYLKLYPDVNNAVNEGIFGSGLDHFIQRGFNEGRTWSCQKKYIPEESGTYAGCQQVFHNFMSAAAPFLQNWTISGDKHYDIQTPNCNALVIIDGRDHPLMDVILKNHRRYLGPYWMFYLIGPKRMTRIWQKYAGKLVTVVELPEYLDNLSDYPTGYNQVLLSEFLWKDTIECENVLVSQTDALLLRHGIGDFFYYDYVGSPIYSETHPTRYWRIMNAFNPNTVGGNGGLSFRKKSAMVRALENCAIPSYGIPEDAWFVACTLLLNGTLPHPTIANRFSVGTKCDVDVPLGTHKLWMNCKTSTCVQTILTSKFHRDVYGESNFNKKCHEGELLYLAMNDDVARAIQKGHFDSGWDHYMMYGKFEKGRIWRCLE